MPALPADLTIATQVADVAITEVVHRTDKTLLATGTRDGQPVVVKCLLDSDPFWVMKWQHEIGIYRAFTDNPPPLRAPRLLYTDNTRLMVLDWIDGHRLDDDRYPQRPVGDREVELVVGTVTTLNRWSPPAGALTAVFDYPERLRRYHHKGYLTGSDYDALTRLLERTSGPSQVNHGDPVAGNIIVGDHDAALVDWEFTGLFLPGFDLAMLHTQLGAHSPHVKTTVDAAVAEAGQQTTFLINLAVVLTRELRIHHELPTGPVRDTVLPLVDEAWAQARDRIHHHAEQVG